MESMNPGKAMAQASHASNAFVFRAKEKKVKIHEWTSETKQGFGTVIVLGVTEKQLRTTVEVSNRMGFLSEVIHDPTYPIRDGEVTHFVPVDTCGYVYGNKDDVVLKSILKNFNLHR